VLTEEVSRPHLRVSRRRRSDPQDDIVAGCGLPGVKRSGQEGIRVGVFGDVPVRDARREGDRRLLTAGAAVAPRAITGQADAAHCKLA